MKERILRHLNFMEEYLTRLDGKTLSELKKMMDKHMTEIYFFMHERFIHLIVMCLFAIGTFMTIFTYVLSDNIMLLPLAFFLLVLLVPYIKHYYLLENGVQKMYKQYDKLLEKIEELEQLADEKQYLHCLCKKCQQLRIVERITKSMTVTAIQR